MIDIDSIAAKPAEAVPMQVLHPETNQPMDGFIIKVRSFAHPDVVALTRKQKTRAAQNRGRNNQIRDLTPEEEEANGIELICVLTEDWEGPARNGKALPCTEDNKRLILGDKKWLWLANDIVRFAGNEANFLASRHAGGSEPVGKTARMAPHKAGESEPDEG